MTLFELCLFGIGIQIKILETTGELMELIVDHRDVAEVLIGA